MMNIPKADLLVIHAALMARLGHLFQMKHLVDGNNWRNAMDQTKRLIGEAESWIRIADEAPPKKENCE